MTSFFSSQRLACLSLLSSICLLSGCALDVIKYGQQVAGHPAVGSAFTGLFTDSNGEIIGYCCTTACAKAESVKEFKNKFAEILADKVSDQKDREKLMGQVFFTEKPPVQCKPDQSIVFKVDYKVGTIDQSRSTTIKINDLGSNGDSAARKDLKTILEKFEEEFANGAKLTIELTTCNGSETAAAQNSSNTIYACEDPIKAMTRDAVTLDELGDTNGQQPARLQACQTCQPEPATEEEIKLDWAGIL